MMLNVTAASESDAATPLVCAECGRKPRDDENAADEWRAYLDVDDDLPVFCRSAPSASSATTSRRLTHLLTGLLA